MKNKNGVGILLEDELRDQLTEVWRANNRMMLIKLVIDRSSLNIISVYAPYIGLDEGEKNSFWKAMD